MHNISKYVVHRMYIVNLIFENHPTALPDYLRFAHSRCICQTNNFPVKMDALENADEFHHLLQCKQFLTKILLYLKCRLSINPSTLTYQQIKPPNYYVLPLCKFIYNIIKNVVLINV